MADCVKKKYWWKGLYRWRDNTGGGTVLVEGQYWWRDSTGEGRVLVEE